MNFKQYLDNQSIIYEEKFIINKRVGFKLPTSIKVTSKIKKQNNVSRSSLRKINFDSIKTHKDLNGKTVFNKVVEVLECIKSFCCEYLKWKGNKKLIVLRYRYVNINLYKILGLNYKNQKSKNKVIRFLMKYLEAKHFYADYPGDDVSSQTVSKGSMWCYEFLIEDFFTNKNYINYFKIKRNITEQFKDSKLYIKFSFRYRLNKKRPNSKAKENEIIYLKQSKDGFIYLNQNYSISLDNISFHLSNYKK